MKIHVGTSGYAYKEWKGIFYPEKLPQKEMLRFYAQRLSAVEINYTFHHMPTERVLAPWTQQVPDGFAFALKAPQRITHWKKLRNVEEEADYFFRALAVLGGKLGPALFQFPTSFRAEENRAALEAFLPLIPGHVPCAFDFRSPTWLDAGIADLLRERGCSLCTEDTDEAPAERIVGTASWGYLRLRRSDYGEADLERWLERILAQDWERAFVFFKHEEEAAGPVAGPEMALRFLALAGEKARV
jgi:uncharacterized protein YecE (DUF72 family)